MKNLNQDDTGNEQIAAPDELTSLKARADLMGIAYHPSIGLDKLREKVLEGITSDVKEVALDKKPAPVEAVVVPEFVPETLAQKRLRLKRDALALVRIRVTCMNPAKKEWEGEIFTCGNTLIGSVTKFVPFNADDGWHVPKVIYNVMRDRMAQIFIEAKDSNGKKIGRTGKLIREFAIEILDPLTPEELSELVVNQAVRRAID